MSYKVSITQPIVGSVQLNNGCVPVQVSVSGDTPIDSVFADTYLDGDPPPDPQTALTPIQVSPDGCSGTYGGPVPAACDVFDIIVEANFDPTDPQGQMIQTTTTQGPYTGQCGNGAPMAANVRPTQTHALVRFCARLGITKRDYFRWIKRGKASPKRTAPAGGAPPPADDGSGPSDDKLALD